MNKGFGLVRILIIVVVIGALGGGYYLLKNPSVTGCQEYQNDVCGLFDCMVDSCWCKESGSSPILFETYISFDNKQGVKDVVNVYIAELINGSDEFISEEAKKMSITKVVKLNDVFYNVFVDKDGEEIVYTVSSDGQIIKTICGV